MRRYIALHLVDYAITRQCLLHGLEPQCAVALTTIRKQQSVLVGVSKAAKKTGIRAGMTAALAKSFCPNIHLFHYTPLEDFKHLYKIALRLLHLSPFVALDNELVAAYKNKRLEDLSEKYHGIIIDITGTERLYSSESALLKKIFVLFNAFAFSTTAGISNSVGSAWALSRYGAYASHHVTFIRQGTHTAFIVKPSTAQNQRAGNIATKSGEISGLEAVLAALPVQALRIASHTSEALYELGLYRIAHLQKYRHKELALRFGSTLSTRLDQIFSRSEETLLFLHPKEHISSDTNFDPPLQIRAAVEAALVKVLLATLEKLAKAQKVAHSFCLIIQGANPSKPLAEASFCIRKVFTLHAASRDAQHLGSIILPFFETLPTPEAVSRISIAAHATRKQTAEQAAFEKQEGHCPKSVRDELLNMLSLQLGSTRIQEIRLHESHTPEKAYTFAPLAPNTNKMRVPQQSFFYPPTILSKPEKITALSLLPDAPPTRIQYAGECYTIVQAHGPERITSEWWNTALQSVPNEREYFRVQETHGRWLWIFRERDTMEWFIHGVWE